MLTENNIGILLTNIGTPDEPTPSAVKKYLKEFLSDRRVIELHPLLWKPILHGYILQTRPKRSAQLYQKIWTDAGSPLLVYSKQLAVKLEHHLRSILPLQIHVAVGMHYGNPSIPSALETLRKKNCQQLLVLPLYPQYSATTTASTFDRVSKLLNKWRKIPHVNFIHHYAYHDAYQNAIAEQIKQFHQQHPIQHLLFSFHGIPKHYADQGDPYAIHCQETARGIADRLKLSLPQWAVVYQSRLGRTPWLGPYTDKTLSILPKQNIDSVHVVCPGFAVDCLETLEEINIRGKEQFLTAGGKNFYYIPSLNASDEHVAVLTQILQPSMMIKCLNNL